MDNDEDRIRICRELWADIRAVSVDTVTDHPAAARAVEAGADPADVVTAMTAAAYEAVFGTLLRLTSEEDLVALAESGAVTALHEDLLTADPTGQEGADLFR